MANTINDNQKEAKQDWFDCPEPSKDFNQTVKETKVNPNSAVYTRQRPKMKNILDVMIRRALEISQNKKICDCEYDRKRKTYVSVCRP